MFFGPGPTRFRYNTMSRRVEYLYMKEGCESIFRERWALREPVGGGSRLRRRVACLHLHPRPRATASRKRPGRPEKRERAQGQRKIR